MSQRREHHRPSPLQPPEAGSSSDAASPTQQAQAQADRRRSHEAPPTADAPLAAATNPIAQEDHGVLLPAFLALSMSNGSRRASHELPRSQRGAPPAVMDPGVDTTEEYTPAGEPHNITPAQSFERVNAVTRSPGLAPLALPGAASPMVRPQAALDVGPKHRTWSGSGEMRSGEVRSPGALSSSSKGRRGPTSPLSVLPSTLSDTKSADPDSPAIPPLPDARSWRVRLAQQTLPSWQTRHSPMCIVGLLLVAALLAVPVGVLVIVSSADSQTVSVRYDHVHRYRHPQNPNETAALASKGAAATFDVNGTAYPQGVTTRVVFTVPERMEAPVYLSYGLTDFFQNHRLYAASVYTPQLAGGQFNKADLSDCDPLRSPPESQPTDTRSVVRQRVVTHMGEQHTLNDMLYHPCGIVAYTMFNDTFNLYSLPPGAAAGVTQDPSVRVPGSLVCNTSDFGPQGGRLSLSPVQNPCEKRKLSWPSDRVDNYKAAPTGSKVWSGLGSATASDPYLAQGWYLDEPGHRLPDPLDEDYHIWGRLSALPTVRKLMRTIHVDLEPGQYAVEVAEFFDADSYGGEKRLVLQTRSFMSGRRRTHGILFTLIAGVCIAAAVAVALRELYLCRAAGLRRRATPSYT